MLSNPKYWEAKAEEARITAQSMTDPDARQMMFEVVRNYEMLARRLATIAEMVKPKSPFGRSRKPPK